MVHYRIAGNFQGRKLSWISRKRASRNVKAGHTMGVACLNSRENLTYKNCCLLLYLGYCCKAMQQFVNCKPMGIVAI